MHSWKTYLRLACYTYNKLLTSTQTKRRYVCSDTCAYVRVDVCQSCGSDIPLY